MISVIIPALDEEDVIARTIRHLENGSNIEVILADGGSHDRTVSLAASCGAMVVHSRLGRAVQMNTGALNAQGEILLFLHADTRLPENYDQHIRQAMTDPGIVAGAFSLGFDNGGIFMKIMAWGANARSRFLLLPYGDQAIFLRKEDFHLMGGFPDLPIMEDAVFIDALKKEGRIMTLPDKAVTSARRYTALGVLHTWIINQCITAGFLMGADPAVLARLYRSHAGITKWVPFIWNIFRRKHGKSV
jgi:rSAM/selenodomain-associated transferase 2